MVFICSLLMLLAGYGTIWHWVFYSVWNFAKFWDFKIQPINLSGYSMLYRWISLPVSDHWCIGFLNLKIQSGKTRKRGIPQLSDIYLNWVIYSVYGRYGLRSDAAVVIMTCIWWQSVFYTILTGPSQMLSGPNSREACCDSCGKPLRTKK